MLSTTGLRYFLEVHRHGSYRAAAEHLFIATSAISRQITLLEEEVGAPLLERGRGRTRLSLTAAGEILIRYAKHLAVELEKTKSDIEALKGLKRGQVLLGIPETFARDFIPDFLVKFNQRYQGISYHIHMAGTPELEEMLIADDLDAALTFNPVAGKDIKVLYQRRLINYLLVPAGHPLYGYEEVKLSDIADYPLALPDRHIGSKRIVDEMFARANFRPRTVLTSNSYELLRSASIAGLSLAIVNQRIGYPVPNEKQYRYIPLRDKRVEAITFGLCVREGRSLPVATLAFIEAMTKEFEQFEMLNEI